MAGLVVVLLVYLLLGFGTLLGFGFGTRALMRSKGRSGAGGFCLGFFLGVIGLLIAALLPATPEEEARRLRRQMELLGIAPGSTGAVPFAAGHGIAGSPAVASPRRTRTFAAIPVAALTGISAVAWVVAKLALEENRRYLSLDLFAYAIIAISLAISIAAVVRRSPGLAALALAARLSFAGWGFLMFLYNAGRAERLVWLVSDLLVLAALVVAVATAGSIGLQRTSSQIVLGMSAVASVLVLVADGRRADNAWQVYLATLMFAVVPLIGVALCAACRTVPPLLFSSTYVALALEESLRALNASSYRGLLGWHQKLDLLHIIALAVVLVFVIRELVAVRREVLLLTAQRAAVPLPPPSNTGNEWWSPAPVDTTEPAPVWGAPEAWPAGMAAPVAAAGVKDSVVVICSVVAVFLLAVPAVVIPLVARSSSSAAEYVDPNGYTDGGYSGVDPGAGGESPGVDGTVAPEPDPGYTVPEDPSQTTVNEVTTVAPAAPEQPTSSLLDYYEAGVIGNQSAKRVRTVAISPDGSRVLSAGFDRTAAVWDLNGYDLLLDIVATHGDSVYEAAYSADGQYVATASEDGSVKVTEVSTHSEPCGSPLFQTAKRGNRKRPAIDSVRFFPNRNWIVAGGEDGYVRVWDLDQCQQIAELSVGLEVFSVDIDPTGTLLAAAAGVSAASRAPKQGMVRLWDASRNFAEVSRRIGHGQTVRDVTFSPDGSLLVTTSYDNTAAVWDLGTFTRLSTLQLSGYVQEASFSSDGAYLVTTQDSGPPLVWEVTRIRSEVSPSYLTWLPDDKVWSAVFVPGSYTIVTGGYGGQIKRWEPVIAGESGD